MRLAFMGTPDFAVPILNALIDAGHDLVRVYAQPARPTGRGHRVQSSPVERRATTLGIAVETPVSLKDEAVRQRFAALDLDAAIVAAYGRILPQAMLAAPRLGCINVHASLLPRWRGAAPIQRAILAGDAETGISIMRMEAGLDTGPVFAIEALPIGSAEALSSLQTRLAQSGGMLLVRILRAIEAGTLTPEMQSADGVTYADRIAREEGALGWQESAIVNLRKVRALNPSPGSWFMHSGERIKVLDALAEPGSAPPGTVLDGRLGIACREGVFRPTLLQRAGRGPVPTYAFLNGLPIAAGIVLP